MFKIFVECEFLPAATKLGQGNIFTRVCDSVKGGGGGGGGLVPGGGRCLQIFGVGGGLSKFFFSNFFSFSFKSFFPKISSGMHQPPPPPRDGQCAAGTHPTGMHSCILCFYLKRFATKLTSSTVTYKKAFQ